MYQYSNYAYSSGVPGSQNVAAYSTRQSAAASHNLLASSAWTTDDAGPRRTDEAAERDLSSPSCHRLTPCHDRSSADAVPPPPTSTSTRLTSPGARSTQLPCKPSAGVMDRVAVRVDADNDDDDARQQHARSHSAPAAPRHPAGTGPPSCRPPPMCYMQSTTPSGSRAGVEPRLMRGPPCDLTTHRPTFPSSDVELNACDTDVASLTTRRANSASLPAVSGDGASCDPVTTRRRLRAARGRLSYQYAASECGQLASALAGMTLIAGVALVLSALGVQLLLRLTAAATHEATNVGDSLLPAATSKSGSSGRTTITRTVLEEAAVALAAVTVALDLCCLMTVSMQCFFAVKLVLCRNGKLRVSSYLEKCSVSRMAASTGLFLSIPIFLLALMLYAVLEYTFTSAITCVIIFTAGIMYVTVTAAHSIHCWNVEKSKAKNFPESPVKSAPSVLPRDVSKQTVNSDDTAVTQLKLSTLV